GVAGALLGVEAGQDQVGAGLGDGAGRGQADAAVGADDQGPPVLQRIGVLHGLISVCSSATGGYGKSQVKFLISRMFSWPSSMPTAPSTASTPAPIRPPWPPVPPAPRGSPRPPAGGDSL